MRKAYIEVRNDRFPKTQFTVNENIKHINKCLEISNLDINIRLDKIKIRLERMCKQIITFRTSRS